MVDKSDKADPVGEAPRAAGRDLSGSNLARAVLDAAKVRRDSAPPTSRKPRAKRLRGYSGAGADPRDPVLFGDVLAKIVKSRGWQQPAAEGAVFGAWEKGRGS